MEQNKFDIIVIGAGAAGIRAASILADHGKKVALVEQDRPGGCCVHRGCIPMKALSLEASRLRRHIEKESSRQGCDEEKRDSLRGTELRTIRQKAWDSFREENAALTRSMAEGITLLQLSRKTRLLTGTAVLEEYTARQRCAEIGECTKLTVRLDGQVYEADDIVLATGSAPWIPEEVLCAAGQVPVYTAESIWELDRLPERIIVAGGGNAGCEIADAMSAFVPQVDLVETQEEILPSRDRNLRKSVRRILEEHGVDIREGCDPAAEIARILGDDPSDVCIVAAAGRKPVFPPERAQEIGLECTEKGFVKADSCGRTSVPHLYCVGDANGQQMNAAHGTRQAEKAAEIILGEEARDPAWTSAEVPDPPIPFCLHMDPPSAFIGMTIDEIRAKGKKVSIGRAPVYAVGAARVRGCAEGTVTVYRDTETDLLRGAWITGPEAEELIHLLQTWILYRIPCAAIRRQPFAHPSLSEGLRMAVEDACGGSPDLPARRRNRIN